MIDLNDLRVFERVASLASFSAAARALTLPKSSVSRSIQRLEAELATRLLQRTTREVVLTESGDALYERCSTLLGSLNDTIEYVGSLSDGPRGCLHITAGIGFGVNVLSALLPEFANRHPNVDVELYLSTMPADLVADRIDVALRMGPMPDSQIVAKKLGVIHRYACASPEYLARKGTPNSFADLKAHDLIGLLYADGRKPVWSFQRGDEVVEHQQSPRIAVNCAITTHRLIMNGAGIGISSGYLCGPEIVAGRLVHLFPDWSLPDVQVHAVFPTQRELSPMVRAFVDFMAEQSRDGHHWLNDPLARLSRLGPAGGSEAARR